MNNPVVTIKDKKYLVTQISIVLKLNSGSLIYLRLSDKLNSAENKASGEEILKQEFLQDIFQEEQEGSFQWQGTTLKFFLVGYNSFEATTFELVGLVVRKNLIDWFKTNKFKDKKQDYLIYQKAKTKNAWPFFNQVLGEQFDKPNEDFVKTINFLFPENGCIWRHKDSDNFNFLNKALTFASRHLSEVQGWCAVDADKPLRIILFEEKPNQKIPKLDQSWIPTSYPFLPNRYSWNHNFKGSCTLSRELSIKTGQKAALIKQLTSDGNNGENDQKGKDIQEENPIRLLFAPGTVTIGDRNIFCHTVTYKFKLPAFGEESPTTTIEVELDYPREAGDNEILSLRLFGKFQQWRAPKDEETEIEIAPPDTDRWGIIDEKTQTLKSGSNAILCSQILSPTYSDKQYSGIYIKHEKNDEMIVDIQPCDTPLVLGSIQKYRQKLEEANITLCGQKLAISVSPHNQNLDNSEAIILDSTEIKLNHGKLISGQAQQAVNFLSNNIELGSTQIDINSGQTKINSLVNVSFPSPKVPTPNIPSSAVVGGLDSGKVGEANKNSAGNRASNKSAASDNSSRTADAVEQPVVNTFGMDVDSPEIKPMDEVDQLVEQFSKMSLQDKVNTFNLHDNCYYCTAAALLDMTVDELIQKSGIMQYAGGGTIEDIKNLFKEVGVPVNYQTVNSKDQLESELKKMQNNHKLGFAYNRQDGSGHMVVLQKNQHGKVSFLDYQKNPVVNKPLQEFLTQENITTAHVFYTSTIGTSQSLASGVFGTSAKTFSLQSKFKAQQYEKQDNGHSLDRHGPEVTDKELINRLTTGFTPDGKISPTQASTRFNNYDDWLVTRQEAMNDIATREGIDLTKPPPPGKEGPFRITKDHGRAIDDGFVGDGNMSKKNIPHPSTGQNKQIKVFSSIKKVDNLTRTTTSIQWNKGSKKWDVKQHFPDAQNWDQTKQTYTK